MIQMGTLVGCYRTGLIGAGPVGADSRKVLGGRKATYGGFPPASHAVRHLPDSRLTSVGHRLTSSYKSLTEIGRVLDE